MSIALPLIAIAIFAVIAFVKYSSAMSVQDKPMPNDKINNRIDYDRYGNVIARDRHLTPTAVKATSASSLREKMTAVHNFYRKQAQTQSDVVCKRNEEQERIFMNYFHVVNYRTTTCTPLFKALADSFVILVIGCIIAGVCGLIFGIIDEVGFGVALGVVFLILKVMYQKKFEATIKSTIAPLNLISHDEYEELVEQRINQMNLSSISLEKLGIDDSQVAEVRPIILRDKAIIDTSMKTYDPEDGMIHSSSQHVTLIYFTDDQLFVYKVLFDMCCNLKTEWTSEFFYQDICDISTKTSTNVIVLDDESLNPQSGSGSGSGSANRKSANRRKRKNRKNRASAPATADAVKSTSKREPILLEYSTVAFDIIASNSSIGFEMVGTDENLASIHGMQQKIRDKKNS